MNSDCAYALPMDICVQFAKLQPAKIISTSIFLSLNANFTVNKFPKSQYIRSSNTREMSLNSDQPTPRTGIMFTFIWASLVQTHRQFAQSPRIRKPRADF